MGVRGRSAAEVEGLLTVSRPCKGFRIAVLVTETAIQFGQSECTFGGGGAAGRRGRGRPCGGFSSLAMLALPAAESEVELKKRRSRK